MSRPFIMGDREPKPPRKQGEVLDLPRRYIVRDARGTVQADAVEMHSRESALSLHKGGQAFLMGTHESVAHAAKRVGWA